MKKILFLLIVFALAIFAACGDTGSNSSQGTGNNGSSSSSNQDSDADSGNGDLGGGSGSGGGYNGNVSDNETERENPAEEESKDDQYAKCGIYETKLEKDKEEYLYKQEIKADDNFFDVVTDAFNKATRNSYFKYVCLYSKDESINAKEFSIGLRSSAFSLYIPNKIIFQDVNISNGSLHFYDKVRVLDNVTLGYSEGNFYDNFYADNLTLSGAFNNFYGGANIKNVKIGDAIVYLYGNSVVDNATNNKGILWLYDNSSINNIVNNNDVIMFDNSSIGSIITNNDLKLYDKNNKIKDLEVSRYGNVVLDQGIINNLTLNEGHVEINGGVIENAKVYGGQLQFYGFNKKSNEGIVKSVEVYEGGTLGVMYGGTINRAEIFSGGRIHKYYTESTITIENLIVHKGADIEIDGFTILNRQDVE